MPTCAPQRQRSIGPMCGPGSQLLQVRIYLDDIANWPAFDKFYAQWIGICRPARAVLPTGPLHLGFKVEVEVIGLLSSSK
jgi:enamine deaminase RidA (YjgF/YER057c/UK114 family)